LTIEQTAAGGVL